MADDRFSGNFGSEQHLDLQADLHFFFDTLVTGKTVLDVGAGLGRSKSRIRHNTITTHEPSEHCRELVDICSPQIPDGLFDIVTAFEVIEHVQQDEGFLWDINAHALQAVFLTTPASNAGRLRELVTMVWECRETREFSFYKDAEGGWCEMIVPGAYVDRKLLVLVSKNLRQRELDRIDAMYAGRQWALSVAR